MPLPTINFLHFTVSEILSGQNFKGQGHYSKVKGQIKVTPWRSTLTTPNQYPYKYQLHTPYAFLTLTTPNQYPYKYQLHTPYAFLTPKQDFVGQGQQGQRSNQGHTMTVHTYTLTNVPTKYQLPTPYSFRDIARTRFYRSRSLWQGQRSNQGHIMTWHTYTP